jgi:hypothetical protein
MTRAAEQSTDRSTRDFDGVAPVERLVTHAAMAGVTGGRLVHADGGRHAGPLRP